MHDEEKPIVVGVDGSEHSLAACRWAATEARLRGHSLELVYSFESPALVPPPRDWLSVHNETAESMLTRAAEQVRHLEPQVAVSSRIVAGEPGTQLVELSSGARQVVVGHRGHGTFTARLLGSVAETVAAHAHSPAVIVRTGSRHTRPSPAPVVVGVDGSVTGAAALAFAFEEADLRAVPVHAVHAYHLEWLPAHAEELDPVRFQEAEQQRLRQWVQPVWDKYPQLTVEHLLRYGHPAACLTEAARDASLLVVGSRGRGGFTGMLLGSVSQQVVRHHEGPVVVVR